MHAVGKREALTGAGSLLGATIQTAGLDREMSRAVVPPRVGTNTSLNGSVSRACSTREAMRSPIGRSRARAPKLAPCRKAEPRGRCVSVNAAILASIVTASSGNLPIADSPESMTQSVPSRIALATSVASARVGRRLVDHRLEHLCGSDHRFAGEIRLRDELFLRVRDFFDWHLHPEIAARHHDAIGGGEDFVECSSASDRSIFAMMNGYSPDLRGRRTDRFDIRRALDE